MTWLKIVSSGASASTLPSPDPMLLTPASFSLFFLAYLYFLELYLRCLIFFYLFYHWCCCYLHYSGIRPNNSISFPMEWQLEPMFLCTRFYLATKWPTEISFSLTKPDIFLTLKFIILIVATNLMVICVKRDLILTFLVTRSNSLNPEWP